MVSCYVLVASWQQPRVELSRSGWAHQRPHHRRPAPCTAAARMPRRRRTGPAARSSAGNVLRAVWRTCNRCGAVRAPCMDAMRSGGARRRPARRASRRRWADLCACRPAASGYMLRDPAVQPADPEPSQSTRGQDGAQGRGRRTYRPSGPAVLPACARQATVRPERMQVPVEIRAQGPYTRPD